jgi:hypothetical protein
MQQSVHCISGYWDSLVAVNSPINIMQNPKVTAINSAIEIDLTGQVSLSQPLVCVCEDVWKLFFLMQM